MFGHKKEITQKFISKSDKESDTTSSKTDSKKEKEKNNKLVQSRESDNFIFYGSNNKFAKQIEIYATINNSQEIIQKNRMVLIVIDSTAAIEHLAIKIQDSFSQYPEYQGLEGLRAINLTKKNEDKSLPLDGIVEDHLKSGDIVYLNLISNDIWIKVNIYITNAMNRNIKLIVSMEVKIRNEQTFKDLRYKLIKCGIICFLNECSKTENNFKYVVSDLKLWTSVHGNIDENKLKNMDNIKIAQLFNFKNSIKLEIQLLPLEFLLFQKLKILSMPKNAPKKNTSWQRFKQMRFKELLNSKKFIQEKIYIFDFFKKLFQNKNSLPKCYIYSIDEDTNTNNTEQSNMSVIDMEKKDIEKNTSIFNINNSIFKDSEDMEIFKINPMSNNQFNISSINNINNSDYRSFLINTSMSGEENEKFTLIVLPPHSDEKNVIIEPQTKPKKARSKPRIGKKTEKNILLKELDFNIINDDDDNYQNLKGSKEANKSSSKFTKSFKKFSFELNGKKEDNDEDINENEITYNGLKSRGSKKKLSKEEKKLSIMHKNLCDDFDKYFEKEKFLELLSSYYLINIEKGSLENSTIPFFRKFKIDEKKNKIVKKRRKKKKYRNHSFVINTVFPVQRLNIEFGIFSIFVLGILIFFSYLLSETYY